MPNLDWSQAQSLNVIGPGAKARVKVALDLSYLQANKNNPVIEEDLADRMSWDRLLGSVVIKAFECDEQLISKPTRKGIEAAWEAAGGETVFYLLLSNCIEPLIFD